MRNNRDRERRQREFGMKARLTKDEFDILRTSALLQAASCRRIAGAGAKRPEVYILESSEDEAQKMRAYCIAELAKSGFDGNYRPTARGRSLEALIDKLFVAGEDTRDRTQPFRQHTYRIEHPHPYPCMTS
jgi:hypothetical protein